MFEVAKIADKRADEVAKKLELVWLTRYPWPTEVVIDRGKEFTKEVKAMLYDEYGCIHKLITTRNPQANAMIEQAHQVIHNMIRSLEIQGAEDLDDYRMICGNASLDQGGSFSSSACWLFVT